MLCTGLKIIQVCFEAELNAHWQKTARVIKEVSKIAEARASFWNYVEFLTTNRNPLFIILLPFLHQKVKLLFLILLFMCIHYNDNYWV